MNEHFKDELLHAIKNDIAANPRGDQPPSRVPTKTLVSAAVVVAVVAGGVALTRVDRPADVLVASDDTEPTTTVEPGADFTRGHVFDTPHGKTFRVPSSSWTSTPPPEVEGQVAFRIADADARLLPMTVTPSIDTFNLEAPVEVIGGREIRTPKGLSFPAGVTEANRTGPWFWTEADGSKWMASGLLSDLRRALPDLAYIDGAMVPGPSLVVDESSPTSSSAEVLRIRDERFEIGIFDDSTSSFDFVDPRAGELKLVDIGGHPGKRSVGGGITWRADANTVISIQRSMASFGGPAPTYADLLAAARSVRPATVAEVKALPVWRGTVDERLVVTIPADLPVAVPIDTTLLPSDDRFPTSGSTQLSVRVNDLDGGSMGAYSTDETWTEYGFALPIGPERIGHRLQLTLEPAAQTYGERPAGQRGCTATVTVPPEDAEPVIVHLEANC